jgi:L-lactate dehydrogenase complex protein LldG
MAAPEMNGREIILGRIREALARQAPHPGTHAAAGGHAADGHTNPQDWLPPVGPTPEEQIALFRANAEALRARFETPATIEDAAALLVSLAAEDRWKRLACHRHPLTDPLAKALGDAGVEILDVDHGYEKDALEACDAGLTACEALVAQTGSVLVASTTCGGRALSVLPPHHVVIARRSQMQPDLAAALDVAEAGPASASMLSFITGPSRTGDIERILVLGAHGPKKLTILLV